MSRYQVIDAHCDTASELWLRRESFDRCTTTVRLSDADALDGYGQFFAICPLPGQNTGFSCEAFYQQCMAYFQEQLRRHTDKITQVGDAASLEAALSAGKSAAFLALEGAEGIGCDPGRLEEARALGLRMVNLTWNADNILAGCAAWDGPGLSNQGREFVRRAQRLGILVDVSHLSRRAFWDVMDVAQAPVVASHSNSFELCRHPRNLTDEQFLALCETGGFAGINFYTAFLDEEGEADLDTVRCHMDHFLQLSGGGHVALGGDLDGCNSLPCGFNGLESYCKLSSHLELCGFSGETVEDIYANTIKRVVKTCIM